MNEREAAPAESGLALGEIIRHTRFCVLPQVDVNDADKFGLRSDTTYLTGSGCRKGVPE